MKPSPCATPIFIGGTGRSGTTVLGDLLDKHSEVRTSNPTEIKFLVNHGGLLDIVFGSLNSQVAIRPRVSPLHYRTFQKRKAREELRFHEFSGKLWKTWWEIDGKPPHGPGLHVGINRKDFEKLLSGFQRRFIRDAPKAGQRFMIDFIEKQFDSGDEKYWAETSPLNIANSHRLFQLFPNAKFITMRRNSRDVIASLLTKNWGPTTPLEGVEWVEKRIRAGHEALVNIPETQKLTIDLEDLVTLEPSKTYDRLLDFLGLEDEPAVRDFHAQKMSAELASTGRWKLEINTPEFVRACEQMDKRLKDSGINF